MKKVPKAGPVRHTELMYDRRLGKRLNLNFPIEISGTDQEGQSFVGQSKTENISDCGCRLYTNINLRCGTVIDIKLIVQNEREQREEVPHSFVVVWTSPEKIGCIVGAKKISIDKIWKVSFPTWPPKPSRALH